MFKIFIRGGKRKTQVQVKKKKQRQQNLYCLHLSLGLDTLDPSIGLDTSCLDLSNALDGLGLHLGSDLNILNKDQYFIKLTLTRVYKTLTNILI